MIQPTSTDQQNQDTDGTTSSAKNETPTVAATGGAEDVLAEAEDVLAKEEARARIEKLGLETRSLKRQLSMRGSLLQWLQAASGPVAVLALAWTVYSGYGQMAQAREDRLEAEFAQAISRLEKQQDVSVRIIAISQLSRFLAEEHSHRQSIAMSYILNAITAEKDPTVRTGLLQALSDLKRKHVADSTLNEALRVLVESDRALIRDSKMAFKDLASLDPSDDRLTALNKTAEGITALVRGGARVQNLSGIYCVACDFSSSDVDLSRTSFDGALLTNANFSRATLRNTSFNKAAILGAKFVGSDLTGAKLTDKPADPKDQPGNIVVWSQLKGVEAPPPDFSCADLGGADFSGQIMFGLYQERDPNRATAWYPELAQAKMEGADLSDIRIFVTLHLPANLSETADLDPFVPFQLKDGYAWWHDSLPRKSGQGIEGGAKHSNTPDEYVVVMNTGPDWAPIEPVRADFRNSLAFAAEALTSSPTWSKAKVSQGLKAYLAGRPPARWMTDSSEQPDCAPPVPRTQPESR